MQNPRCFFALSAREPALHRSRVNFFLAITVSIISAQGLGSADFGKSDGMILEKGLVTVKDLGMLLPSLFYLLVVSFLNRSGCWEPTFTPSVC
jgi:hypothetical protein